MTDTDTRAPEKADRWRFGALEALTLLLIALLIGQRWIAGFFDSPALQAGATIFVSIVVQATPFLVLGVLLSAAIAAFVPPAFWQRALPKNDALAVPVAGMAGAILPGCECASVPVAGSLMSRGVAPAAALAFLLSAPAINPIVLVSTWVAFPNNPMMVLARFVASLITSVLMGWIWLRFGKSEWLRIPRRDHLVGHSNWETFRLTAIPPSIINSVAGHPLIGVLFLAALAVVLCICSEADAFVAASLSQFSLTARLAFLVVGPMVDIKLVSLQAGVFGRRFASRFAPTTFVVAVVVSIVVGLWLL